MAAHQANYARICQLRAASQKLDDQSKDTVKTLADLRREILATPATVFPESQNSVNYHELLSYAKRISRFTVPPTYRPPAPWDAKPSSKKTSTPASPDQYTSVPDATSPAAGENGKESEAPAPTATEEAGPGVGLRDLNESTRDWLDPLAKLPFVPWPDDTAIRSGGLAIVQYLIEAGKDPTTDPKREEQEAEERRKLEEEENARRDKELLERKLSYAVGANGYRPSKQEEAGDAFSLDLYDPDEA